VSPTGVVLPVYVEMVENGTLTTLPYCSVLTVASNMLAVTELSTGAWPGVNQAAGRLATALRVTGASPYQVLRVANWSAGMLNYGM
jgi:hypothetical protein